MKTLLIALLMGLSITAQAKVRTFVVTAYCPCQVCCGSNSGGPTASGKMPRMGLTAAGPTWMKFGTKLAIPGLGVRVVQDRLASPYEGRIDVFVKSHKEAQRFGSRRLKIRFT